MGATCDNFLTKNQLILNEEDWQKLQALWNGVECTSSKTLGDIKGELEKLCSLAPCSYDMKKAIEGLDKILGISQKTELDSKMSL